MKIEVKDFIKKMAAVIAAIVITGAALMPTPAQAENNHADTAFSYSTGTSANISAFASGARKKLDATSAYMNCKSCTVTTTGVSSNGAYKGTVYGAKTKTGTYSNMTTSSGKSSITYTFSKGSVNWMINYVNECGGTYAKIWCKPYGSGSGNLTFTGVWSPDSVTE